MQVINFESSTNVMDEEVTLLGSKYGTLCNPGQLASKILFYLLRNHN